MNAPDLTYDFYIKDAHIHWCIHHDGLHITECDSESGVTINGVKADKMFLLCRNALACKRELSVFHELSNQPTSYIHSEVGDGVTVRPKSGGDPSLCAIPEKMVVPIGSGRSVSPNSEFLDT